MLGMLFLGIDPGKNGGLATIDSYGIVEVHKMPDTAKDVYLLLCALSAGKKVYAVLERVASSPQMGVTSAFTFGRGFGNLEVALYAAGIQFEMCQPAKWMRFLGCLTRGQKSVTKIKAQQLFPSIKVTNYVADALLIAEYARRTYVTAS